MSLLDNSLGYMLSGRDPGGFYLLYLSYRAKNLHQRNREFRKLALGCPREIHHDDQKQSRDELLQRTENSTLWEGPMRGWLPAYLGSARRPGEWKS